jgi:hypothetical protein
MDGSKQAAAFVRKLYEMVSDDSLAEHIRWNDKGDAIQILRMNTLESEVLPRHFKHSNLRSFIRQLNMYGFRRRGSRGSLIAEFYHHFFRRSEVEHLPCITRGQMRLAGGALAQPGDDTLSLGAHPTILHETMERTIMQVDNMALQLERLETLIASQIWPRLVALDAHAGSPPGGAVPAFMPTWSRSASCFEQAAAAMQQPPMFNPPIFNPSAQPSAHHARLGLWGLQAAEGLQVA